MSIADIDAAISRLRGVSDRANYATRIRAFVKAVEEDTHISVSSRAARSDLYDEALDEFARLDILHALAACAKRHEVAVAVVLDDLKPRERGEPERAQPTPSLPVAVAEAGRCS